MPNPVFTDENGYRRWAGDGKLVHRGVAYKKIYLPNKDSYPLPFSEYVVHHKDENKKNNDVSNLQIVTREEHERIHGFSGISLSEVFSEMLVDKRVHWLISAGSIWYAPGLVLVDLFGENSSILIIPKILLGIFIIATIITAWVPNVKLKKKCPNMLGGSIRLSKPSFFPHWFHARDKWRSNILQPMALSHTRNCIWVCCLFQI